MKSFYSFLIFVTLLSYNNNFAQKNSLNFLNGMKYASYSGPGEFEYIATAKISKIGLIVLPRDTNEWPKEAKFNPSFVGYWNLLINSGFGSGAKATLQISNCFQVVVYDKTNTASGFGASFDKNMNVAVNRAFDNFEGFKYRYDKSLTEMISYPEVESINMDENQLKAYFDSTELELLEGVYKTYKSESDYKLGIIKVGDKFKAIVVESDLPQWKKGDVKAVFDSTAVDGVYSAKYFMGDKTFVETFANLEGGLFTIEFKNKTGENEDIKLLKLYPKK